MRVGVVYPQIELGGSPEAVREIGSAAETLGYDHLLMYDHVVGANPDREPKLWGPYTDQHPFHDPLVAFGFLSGITRRLQFITGCVILPQRQTVLVAKQATDVELLSDGRLTLGVGAGWNPVEYEALGQDFHTRGRRLDEQIGFLRRLWSEPLLTWAGEFDRIDRACIIPRPKRRIPVWIGGFGEAAFRRAGRLGEGFIFAGPMETVIDAWARVRHHLAEAGRSLEGFGALYIMTSAKSVDDAITTIERWRREGGTHASIYTMDQQFHTVAQHVDYLGKIRCQLTS
ncbi:LLM class F420-dependent oxidoreductase [Steroidobacter denitrificans]|uniref:LLM class F420-dependent oxidoreductase n=1 Tax=Steroidobacter denitrificans TaxID=465721 RepID=UPI000836718F